MATDHEVPPTPYLKSQSIQNKYFRSGPLSRAQGEMKKPRHGPRLSDLFIHYSRLGGISRPCGCYSFVTGYSFLGLDRISGSVSCTARRQKQILCRDDDQRDKDNGTRAPIPHATSAVIHSHV